MAVLFAEYGAFGGTKRKIKMSHKSLQHATCYQRYSKIKGSFVELWHGVSNLARNS